MPCDESTLSATDSLSAERDSQLGLLWVSPDSGSDGAPRPGLRFSAIGTQAVIGRAPECDILIQAAQVSRRHLWLRRNGPLLVAEDLQSRNGTYYDGQRVNRTVLRPGGVLRVGEALAIVWDGAAGAHVEHHELVPGFFAGPSLCSRLEEFYRVAGSDLPVIVEGQTGCGKEGVATAVHRASGRTGRLVSVNCAALPESLAESQLFGYRRGAFTGAHRNEIGYLGAAHGGTLFLDEVLELRPSIQASLLRSLQQKEYVPLGETSPIAVDLRVIVASQEPLERAVAEGRFREDLYARLNGYRVYLAPLRERREDIPFLFRHFLQQRFGGRPPVVRARLLEALCLYDWPQNVRELLLFTKRLSVLHGHEPELGLAHVEGLLPMAQGRSSGGAGGGSAEREGEQPQLERALSDNQGNILRAARQLGISRARAYRLMLALGIDARKYRRRPSQRPA